MKEKKKTRSELRSWVTTVIVPVLIVLLLNLFVCKLAVVSGDSMYPTLHDRDFLLVWMLGYEPKNNDIVVINTDPDGVMRGEKIVKRVIACGGQEVGIDYAANTVTVDGAVLDEPYLNYAEADPMEAYYPAQTLTVPDGYVFVLGDNRNHSGDSRDPGIGLIAESDILGVRIARLPLGEWLGK